MIAARRLAGSTALAYAFAALTVPAAAHAVLEAADPAAGARVERAPARVTLTFDEPVETSLGSVRVIDDTGALIAGTGAVVHPGGVGSIVAVTLPSLPRGRYVVVWNVVSADSHVVGGAYAFGVGEAAGAPPPLERDPGDAIVVAVVHAALLAGALLAIGWPIGALVLGASDAAGFVEFGAWFVVATAAFADIALRAAINGGTLLASFATRAGEVRTATIAIAIAGIAGLAGVRRRRVVLVPACVALALTLGLIGHAADAPLPALGVAADVLHLLAAAAWIGVLAVGATLGPSAVLRRISPVAAIAVGTIVLTGTVAAIRNVGGWTPFLTTAYGRAIDLKVVLLLAALAVAWTARRALARGAFAFRRRLTLELAILAAVVAVSAVLIDLPLPREEPHAVATASTAFRVRDVAVRVAATPVDARHWQLRVDTTPAGALAGVDASVTEAGRHAGPFPVAMSREAGGYAGAIALPFAGAWSAYVSARAGEFDENHTTLPLTGAPSTQ